MSLLHVFIQKNLRERDLVGNPFKFLKAEFSSDAVSGMIEFKQPVASVSAGIWTVTLTDFDKNALPGNGKDCRGVLNFHIHETPLPEGNDGSTGDKCGASVTGGHLDTTYGCGGASEWQSKTCAGDRPIPQGEIACCKTLYEEGKKTCDPDFVVSTCEVGDLSNKLGQIKTGKDMVGVEQVFNDNFINNIDELKDLPIVIHCAAPRVTCANLEVP